MDELHAVAMSLGRVLADTALALWDIKVHKGKGAEKKIEVHSTFITAAVLLKRAREKAARNKKKILNMKKRPRNWRRRPQASTVRP